MNTQHPDYPKHRKAVQKFSESAMTFTSLVFALITGYIYFGPVEHKGLAEIVNVLGWVLLTSIAIHIKDYFSRKKFEL